MNNDPELDGKYLGSITSDFVKVAATLKEAAYQLRARKISAYPVFPISRENLPIGQLLLGMDENKGLSWNYFFTFLEELTDRGIVGSDRADDFKQAYKDPEEFCCLFVVDKNFVNFVYVPYPEE